MAKYCSKPPEVTDSSRLPIASNPPSRLPGSNRPLIWMSGPKTSATALRYWLSVRRRVATVVWGAAAATTRALPAARLTVPVGMTLAQTAATTARDADKPRTNPSRRP